MILVGSQAYRAQYGTNAIFLLPVNLYGPRRQLRPRDSHVIPALIRKMVEARSAASRVVLWGDGTPTREFLYVDDASTALLLAAERYDGADPVNLGTGMEISIADLAALDRAAVGYAGAIHWDTTKPNGQPRRKLDMSRAEAALRFRAAVPLATASGAPSTGTGQHASMTRTDAARGAAGRVLARMVKTVDVAVGHPRASLAILVVGQLIATVAFALTATHNGWLYYQGGDQIWYATSGWSLGDLRIPNALVGYGWSISLAPITWLTGPTFVQSLPAIVVVNVLVMGPAALLCIYAIAGRIGGRLLGLWAALLWVVAPYLSIPLFVGRYHEKFVDQFLPQALGLTAMADYFSMVVLLMAAVFVLPARSIGARGRTPSSPAPSPASPAGRSPRTSCFSSEPSSRTWAAVGRGRWRHSAPPSARPC